MIVYCTTIFRRRKEEIKINCKLGFIVFSAPKAQKLLPGEKLAKIFDF
jgi:hypothetical protein